MALVDGQLAPAEVPGLVQELARDARLVAELQEYLAVSRSRIADAFAAKGDEPVPAWLIDAVARPPAAAPRARPDASPWQRLVVWLTESYRMPAWSLAALPACVAALAILAVWLATPRASLLADADPGVALERAESGRDTAIATVRPVLSFASKTDGWCRQFEVRYANRQVSHALACRAEDGRWKVVAATSPGATGFAPAGAERRRVIDDLVTSMMRGEPLSQADEAAAIGRGWRQP